MPFVSRCTIKSGQITIFLPQPRNPLACDLVDAASVGRRVGRPGRRAAHTVADDRLTDAYPGELAA
eukprot:COSAG06_NODE_33_length_31080_cov_10.329428_6_plen_66_part_00